MLIAAGTRDEKIAFAGAAREKKMKRIVQGMRRPDPKVRSALEAWKAEGDAEAD